MKKANAESIPPESGSVIYDMAEDEPPFEEWELERAVDLRRRGHARVGSRGDICPHTPMCPNDEICIENIAWYLRHQQEIEHGTMDPR